MKNQIGKLAAVSQKLARLPFFTDPSGATVELLGKNGTGNLFLDVGAGPDGALGERLRNREVNYIALDNSRKALKAQNRAGNPTIKSSILSVDAVRECMYVVHERFVLQYLGTSDRETVIREMARVATDRLIFLERDWLSFRGAGSIGRFAKFAIRVLQAYGVNVLAGQTLEESVRTALSGLPWRVYRARRFKQGKIRTAKNVLLLAERIAAVLQEDGNEGALATLGRITEEIKREAVRVHRTQFTLPDVVAVCAISIRYPKRRRGS